METLFILTVIFCIALVSRALATLATVPWGPLFPLKPFNCEACLTFWFTFLGCGLAAWYLSPCYNLHPAIYAVGSFLISIINFINVKSKFKINE